jgi:hypothetical protein
MDADDLTTSFLRGRPAISGSECSSAVPEPDGQTPEPSFAEQFIDILGIAQQYVPRFLKQTWMPELDIVGRGATAEIHEAYADAQIDLAFKRFLPPALAPGEEPSLAPFAAELSVLAMARWQPHILNLEGICFKVRQDGSDWPVLIFQMSRYGDLYKFMTRGAGKELSFNDWLELCVDIAKAIETMHSIGRARIFCPLPETL